MLDEIEICINFYLVSKREKGCKSTLSSWKENSSRECLCELFGLSTSQWPRPNFQCPRISERFSLFSISEESQHQTLLERCYTWQKPMGHGPMPESNSHTIKGPFIMETSSINPAVQNRTLLDYPLGCFSKTLFQKKIRAIPPRTPQGYI